MCVHILPIVIGKVAAEVEAMQRLIWPIEQAFPRDIRPPSALSSLNLAPSIACLAAPRQSFRQVHQAAVRRQAAPDRGLDGPLFAREVEIGPRGLGRAQLPRLLPDAARALPGDTAGQKRARVSADVDAGL